MKTADHLREEDPIILAIWLGANRHGLHTMAAISRVTGIKYGHLAACMRDSNKITVEDMARLHIALGIDVAGAVTENFRRKSI